MALAAAGGGPLRAAKLDRLKVGVITDEISFDLEAALKFLQGYGLRYVEIRKVWGEVWLAEADDATVRKVRELLQEYKMKAETLASPYLKTTLPGATPVNVDRKQLEELKVPYQGQQALLERSIARAHDIGAGYVRIFSFWRAAGPAALFGRIAEHLTRAAETAAQRKMKLVLENEHTCNVATGEEAARMLDMVKHPSLGLNWDPGNALAAGERPFPDAYNRLPKQRVWHMHIKDVRRNPKTGGHRWLPVGKGEVDYRGQFRAMLHDGYQGMFSLETHYEHPSKDKQLATKESLEGLLSVLRQV